MKNVKLISRTYIVLLVFDTLQIFKILLGGGTQGNGSLFSSIFTTILIGLILYGIFKVKKWVVKLVLYLSYIAIPVIFIMSVTEYYNGKNSNIFIIIKSLLISFYIFQAYVFSRKEIKEYFNPIMSINQDC